MSKKNPKPTRQPDAIKAATSTTSPQTSSAGASPSAMKRQRNSKQPRPFKLVAARVEEASTETRFIPIPQGGTASDKFLAVDLHHSRLVSKGIYEGDRAVAIYTKDVRSGELATVKRPDGYYCTGFYYPAPGGYIRIESEEGVEVFRPGQGELAGRVIGVLRDDQYILTACTFRPIR